jgi:hypothetical protein
VILILFWGAGTALPTIWMNTLPPSSDRGPPKHEAVTHKQDQQISNATAELSSGQLESTRKQAHLIALLLISH